MKKVYVVKCPDCGVTISLKADPEHLPAGFACPSCKIQHPFGAYISVDDKTLIQAPGNSRPGYLVDEAGHCYPLKEGLQTLGRASASEQRPDIPVETQDHGFSRIHFSFDVRLCSDGMFHHYVSLARAKAETRVAGRILRDGDVVGLQGGDTLEASQTKLTFIEVKV